MIKRRNNLILINILLIIGSLIKYNFSYIVLPFKYRSFPKTTNMTEIIYNLLDNKLIITLSIGSPPKNIDFYASMNEYIYYLEEDSCLIDSKSSYSNSNSETFSLEHEEEFCPVKMDICSLCQDKIYLYEDINLKNKTEIFPFNFYFGNNKNNKKGKGICGRIGFQKENIPYHIYEYENFIRFLKKNSKIISYSWYIHYFETPFKKNDNEIYDGAIIFDIFNKKFNDDFPYFKSDNDYYYVNSKDLRRILAWTFIYDKIYYTMNDTRIEINNKEIGLAFEIDVVLCPEEYFESIKNNYFDYYFQNNICFLVEGKYNYIYCNKNNFENNIKNFPSLYFESNGLNKTFILNGDDLFKEYNNYLLFMVVLEKNSYKLWALGKIFMKKYNFYFDNDKKIIGCFDKVLIKDESKQNFFDKIKWYLFIIIGVIIGFLIGKKIRDKARKLRANELEDKYEYLENKKKDKDNIDTNTISNYKEIKSQLFDMSEENN